MVWDPPPAPAPGPEPERRPGSEKLFVYIVVASVIAFIIVAVGWFSERAVETYANAANAAQDIYANGHLGAQDALTYRLVFARAQDATLVKGGALLLSFLVVILGVLIVLEGSKAFYKLNVEGARKKSALETSSPGLVMITLGMALVYGVMMYKTEFNLSTSRPVPPPESTPVAEAPEKEQEPGVSRSVVAAPTGRPPREKEPRVSRRPVAVHAITSSPEPIVMNAELSGSAPPASESAPPVAVLPSAPKAPVNTPAAEMVQRVAMVAPRMPDSRMDLQVSSLQKNPREGITAPIPEVSKPPFGREAAQSGSPDGGIATSPKSEPPPGGSAVPIAHPPLPLSALGR